MSTTLHDPEIIRIPDPDFDDLEIELDPEEDSEEINSQEIIVDTLDCVKLVPIVE